MKNKMIKKQVLFLLHIPPPIHGSSMVGKYIYESKLINRLFNVQFINLLASKTVDRSGKLSLRKILFLFSNIIGLTKKLIFNKIDLCYFALSTTGVAFLKDSVLVVILKFFRIPIIFHLHNKGIRNYAKNKIYRQLYLFVFRNTKVILLSQNLYTDISEFVNLNQVKICPNGIPFRK